MVAKWNHDDHRGGRDVPPTIPRADPFPLTWEPFSGTAFALLLQFTADGSIAHGVQCFFPAMDGAGTVPAAALTRFETSAAVDHTNFYFGAMDHQRRELAESDLELHLWNGNATRVGVE